MYNILYQLNSVKKHNEIVRLKRDKKMAIAECKNLVLDYQNKYQAELSKMNKKVDKLEQEIASLKNEKDFYKEIVDKLPKFILKIFCGKNKLL